MLRGLDLKSQNWSTAHLHLSLVSTQMAATNNRTVS